MSEHFEDYAARFNSLINDHAVISPFGAWVLAAAVAPENEEDFRLATDLIASPPPGSKVGLGFWYAEKLQEKLQELADSLREVTTPESPIPNPERLDQWVDHETLGIIKKMPVDITPETLVLLASTIATDVQWTESLHPVPSDAYMQFWGTEQVLRSNPEQKVYASKVDHRLYGVHVAESPDGIKVYSVIADDPEASPQQVLADTYTLVDGRGTDVPLESLNDVVSPINGRNNLAFLPAWSSQTEVDLESLPNIGVERIKQRLQKAGVDGDAAFSQVVHAEYRKDGFKAAALTTVVVSASMAVPIPKSLSLSFSRPYAVLALSGDVPIFNGWIAKAVEP